MENVLKNVVCFLDILRNSSTEQVTLWNEDSVRNAYKWASYCEQVYKHAEGKPYYCKLNLEIKNLNQLVLGTQVDAAFLKHSSKCLTKTMLMNDACSATLSVLVLSQNGITLESVFPEKSDMFFDITWIKRISSFLEIVMNHHQMLGESAHSSAGDIVQNISASKRFISCLTELLLQRLIQFSRISDKMVFERICTVFDDRVKQLCDSLQQGVEVVAMALIKGRRSEKRLLRDGIQSIMLNCLLNITDKNSSHLWNLNLNILCRLCMDNSLFLSVYLQYLIRCCSKLVLVYNEAPVCVPKELFTWQCIDESRESLKYEEFVHRLQHLTEYGSKNVTTKVKDTLQKLAARDGEISVWNSLVIDLKL